jgi:hypothetical protein
MKKVSFFEILIVLFIILSAVEAFSLPNPKAKLSLFIMSGSVFILLLRGRIPNSILIPTGLIYVIASIVLYVFFIF